MALGEGTTGGIIAQGASGVPAESTQLAAKVIAGARTHQSVLSCSLNLEHDAHHTDILPKPLHTYPRRGMQPDILQMFACKAATALSVG